MKKVPNYKIFTYLALAFLFGVAGATILNLNWQKSWPIFILIVALLLVSGLFNLFYKNRVLVLLSWMGAVLVLGLSWYVFYDQKSQLDINFGIETEFSGIIVREPEKDYKQQKIVVETSNFNRTTNVLINAPRYPDLDYGDKVNIIGEIEKPGVIEDFDYGNYLKRYAVYSVIYQPKSVEKTGQSESTFAKALKNLYSIPKIFEAKLNTVLTEPQASLVGGLLFGTKRSIPDSLKNDLSTTGLTHIIALSGYNVTIIITVLSLILARYFGNKKAFWLGLILVVFFVIITGAAPSVVRAAIFSILIIYGRLLGRRGYQTNLMLLAAVLIVFFNPYLLVYDVGFQLSFGAFAGLIYLSPILGTIFEKSKAKYLPVYLSAPLIETLAAQIMVLPLLILYFGKLSLISPLANILILWIIPLAMLFSLTTAIGSLIWWPLGKLLSFIAWPTLSYITALTNLLAKLPMASIDIKDFNFFFAAILYLIIIFLILYFRKRLKISKYFESSLSK